MLLIYIINHLSVKSCDEKGGTFVPAFKEASIFPLKCFNKVLMSSTLFTTICFKKGAKFKSALSFMSSNQLSTLIPLKGDV